MRLPPIVLISVFYYLYVKRLFVFVENGRIKTSYGPSELFYGIIGFICAVILSNFVGYIFNAVVGFLGKLFSLSEAFAKPFDTHPLEFTIFLLIFTLIGIAYLLLKSRWKIRESNIFIVIIVMFSVLFATYISTSLYTAVRGDKTADSKEHKSTERETVR
jgi:hypothetical protein